MVTSFLCVCTCQDLLSYIPFRELSTAVWQRVLRQLKTRSYDAEACILLPMLQVGVINNLHYSDIVHDTVIAEQKNTRNKQ